MEFAKQELAKYGWTEGMGLGRDGSGITKALKPQLKFDKTGMGHDAAETFTNHWWEKAFNAAAENITVNKYVDGSVTLEAENSFEISEHKGLFKKKKHLVYDNFVKMATLTNQGGMAEEPREAEKVPLPTPVPTLTDEELFRACGGRTAHKGARHGLGLNGKLARIEQQERLLLNLAEKVPEKVPQGIGKKSKMSNDVKVSCDLEIPVTESQKDETNVKDTTSDLRSENSMYVKKVKKSKRHKTDHSIQEISTNAEHLENNSKLKESEMVHENYSNVGDIKSKKSKRSCKEKDKSVDKELKSGVYVEEKTGGKRKRRKKSKASIDTFMEEEVEVGKPSKKSKKRYNLLDLEEGLTQRETTLLDEKEKRKKSTRVAEMLDSTACNEDNSEMVEDAVPMKKKKKSRRKEKAE